MSTSSQLILLIGGSGTLGTELQKHLDSIAPKSYELNISNYQSVATFIDKRYDIVINCAAYIKPGTHYDPVLIHTNIIGSANVALACQKYGSRYVYISTDYVYPDGGNKSESDHLSPFGLYAHSKLAGEASASCVKDHLIIRTSFYPNQFPFDKAYSNKYSSKDYVDIIAPMIVNAAKSGMKGIVNIGTERKNIYELAIRRKEVQEATMDNNSIPSDTSMDTTKFKEYQASYENVTNCRCCGSIKLKTYLNLGNMPLANNLEETQTDAWTANSYSLQVMVCEDCSLSQLSVVVDPELLFKFYRYRSSMSQGYKKHCRDMAFWAQNEFKLNDSSFHIDIAGNDGALLQEFKGIVGGKQINVDPAENLCKIAMDNGIMCDVSFWGQETAKRYEGSADLITATNVFAHVDDMIGFLEGVKIALSEGGKFVLEFPYIVDFIEKNEFDTIYFEHLSYISLSALWMACERVGLNISGVQKHSIHGGTMRVVIDKGVQPSPDLELYVREEQRLGFNSLLMYDSWGKSVHSKIQAISNTIKGYKRSGLKIAAFAASAKGNTLMNACDIDYTQIDYIVDETPEKIGKYSPGTGIRIVGMDHLRQNPPDILILLSWNFKDEIIAKTQFYKGKYLVPIPNIEVI